MASNFEKEDALREFVFSQPKERLDDARGHPDKVIALINEYYTKLGGGNMNVGNEKGNVVVKQIKSSNPKVMIELGGYVGFSAIYFSRELPAEAHYYSFELNEHFAGIARQFIDLAGLSDKVTVIVGPAKDTLAQFAKSHNRVDIAFIDHWKDVYVPDLRILESLNLVQPGTIVIADNLEYPGSPEYLKYVRLSPEERKKYHEEVKNVNGEHFTGDWKLVYDFELIKPSPDFWDAVGITHVKEYTA